MAREQETAGDPEASLETDATESLLDRRDYLRATGLLAGGIGLGAVGTGALAAGGEIPVEAQSVSANHEWTTVELADSYASPVVLAPSLSFRGPQAATTRVRNVTGTAFEIAVEEWLYLDGSHRYETVGCLVADSGAGTLADGTTIEAGVVRTDHRWSSAQFSASFSTAPVVFSQTQTVEGSQPVVTRHRDVSGSGFAVRVQEEEAQGHHRTEDVGYLAVEPGTGTLNGRAFEAGSQADVGDSWQTLSFGDSYPEPVFVADLQTFRGANTCAVRYRNLTDSSVEVKVEEERSGDSETAHLGERVGYIVVEGTETTAADGDTPLSELDRSRVERLVHEYVNDRRAEHGLAALAFDSELQEIARYHSEDMAENDYLAHTSPSGETVSDRYEKFGYDCRAPAGDGRYYTGAENVAYTYYDRDVRTDSGVVRYTNADELARGLVRGWMNSEGHRENILLDAWDDEGIGVSVTSEGKVYATQNFC